jgi:hypothetical protein
MAEAENGGFKVHMSQTVREQFRNLNRLAIARGQGDAFVSALKRIVQPREARPHATGEPLYKLPNLRLQVRSAAIAPLVITFAVSTEHPYIYIKSGTLLSG